jgi:hypothetical protein
MVDIVIRFHRIFKQYYPGMKTTFFTILSAVPLSALLQNAISVDPVFALFPKQEVLLPPDTVGAIHRQPYFFPNGQINRIETYQTVRTPYMTQAEIFEANLLREDSTVLRRKWISTEVYFYNDSWILDHIETFDSIQLRPWHYLNHPDSEIELKEPVSPIYIRQCTGCTTHFSIPVMNHSNQFIRLGMIKNNNPIVPDLDTFMIPPGKQVEIGFTLTTDSAFHQYDIALSNDSISRIFRIQAFGYDLAGTQIKHGAAITLPQTFYYLPSGKESLLTIYDRKRKEVLLRIPLGRANQLVDMTALKPGKYWIERTDFETGPEGCILILTE